MTKKSSHWRATPNIEGFRSKPAAMQPLQLQGYLLSGEKYSDCNRGVNDVDLQLWHIATADLPKGVRPGIDGVEDVDARPARSPGRG
jgi:hypothetical protein